MRISSSPHLSCALAVLPPKFPLRSWLVLSLLLSFVSGHERIETFSIRFFMGNWKPETWECHVTTVLLSRLPFGVHFWTAERAFSGKWLTARFFFASKNFTALRLKVRISFLYPPVMCYFDFWPRSNELFMFLGEKSEALRIYEKLHGDTKKLEIPATWNCKLKNLMLKVSNITASPQRFSRLKINWRLRDDWGRVSLRFAISKSYDAKNY